MTPLEAWGTIRRSVEFYRPDLDAEVAVVAEALIGTVVAQALQVEPPGCPTPGACSCLSAGAGGAS